MVAWAGFEPALALTIELASIGSATSLMAVYGPTDRLCYDGW